MEKHQTIFMQFKKFLQLLLLYPGFDKPFNIYTNAGDLQISLVISQNKKPIAF